MSITQQKSKCIALCARPISLNAAQAGDKCAYHFIRDLAEENDLHLVLIVNADDVVEGALVEELGLSSLQVFRIGRWRKMLMILTNLLKGIPPRYGSRLMSSISDEINRKISSESYDHIYYEFSQCAPYQLSLTSSIKSTLSIHDVQMQVVLRARTVESFLFSSLTYQYEKKLFKNIDKLDVLCDKDRNLIDGLYQHKNINIRPPPLSEFVKGVHREGNFIELHSILFWGAMARPENEEAAWFLIKHVFPRVKEKFHDAKLYVVGSQPSRRIQEAGSDSIIVTGFVEDPTPYFTNSQLGVLPLMRGAGIKLKTLEMLACGIPVVTTDIGSEGVSSNDLLTVVDLENMVATVVDFFLSEEHAIQANDSEM